MDNEDDVRLRAPVAPPDDPRTQDEIDRPAEEVIREIRGTPGGLAALYTVAPSEVSAGTCKIPLVCGKMTPLGHRLPVCSDCSPTAQPAPSPISPDGGMAKDPSTGGRQGIHDGPKPAPSPGDAVAVGDALVEKERGRCVSWFDWYRESQGEPGAFAKFQAGVATGAEPPADSQAGIK